MITVQRCNVFNNAYQRMFNLTRESHAASGKHMSAGIRPKSSKNQSLGQTTMGDILLFPYHFFKLMYENLSKMCE